MAIFKHFYDNGVISTGKFHFRHYGQIGASGETWVLNETLTGNNYLSSNVSFTNNNTQYDIFTFAGNEKPKYLEYGKVDAATSIIAYTDDGWENQAYRTITFDNPVTNTTLLTWLQANGTKQ